MRISDWSSDVCSSDLQRGLRDRTVDPGPRPCRAGQRREVDMGGQVGAARCGQGVMTPVPPHRLQRGMKDGPGMAVVDDQRRAAAARDTLGERKRGGYGKAVDVSSALGGPRYSKKKRTSKPNRYTD